VRLILDVVNGDKRLFIRNDQLDAAWAPFTTIFKVEVDCYHYFYMLTFQQINILYVAWVQIGFLSRLNGLGSP
jgi:hypothetical protein